MWPRGWVEVSMTAALEGGQCSEARPSRTLPPGKTRYPFYRRLGGPQGRSGRAENLVPTGIRSRTVQPVVSRYTDWATGPTFNTVELHLSGLNGTADHPDMQKIRKIGFLFEKRKHWQSEVRLLLFTVCTCVYTFRPRLIWGSSKHNTLLYLSR